MFDKLKKEKENGHIAEVWTFSTGSSKNTRLVFFCCRSEYFSYALAFLTRWLGYVREYVCPISRLSAFFFLLGRCPKLKLIFLSLQVIESSYFTTFYVLSPWERTNNDQKLSKPIFGNERHGGIEFDKLMQFCLNQVTNLIFWHNTHCYHTNFWGSNSVGSPLPLHQGHVLYKTLVLADCRK